MGKGGLCSTTSIQSFAIPTILDKKDIIAQSPTGTGKTLAYLLPVLNAIDTEKLNVQAVIMASSQELVMQNTILKFKNGQREAEFEAHRLLAEQM